MLDVLKKNNALITTAKVFHGFSRFKNCLACSHDEIVINYCFGTTCILYFVTSGEALKSQKIAQTENTLATQDTSKYLTF